MIAIVIQLYDCVKYIASAENQYSLPIVDFISQDG